jgi:hypothetical protein
MPRCAHESTYISINDSDILDRKVCERIACFVFENALKVRKLVVFMWKNARSTDDAKTFER